MAASAAVEVGTNVQKMVFAGEEYHRNCQHSFVFASSSSSSAGRVRSRIPLLLLLSSYHFLHTSLPNVAAKMPPQWAVVLISCVPVFLHVRELDGFALHYA